LERARPPGDEHRPGSLIDAIIAAGPLRARGDVSMHVLADSAWVEETKAGFARHIFFSPRFSLTGSRGVQPGFAAERRMPPGQNSFFPRRFLKRDRLC
jgi:hypothetical protein